MEEHEEALADAVALIASAPESGPLAQGVDASGGAAANGLVDAEVDLHEARGAVVACAGSDGGDLADKDDACGIGHLVERFFYGLRIGGWLLGMDVREKREGDRKPEKGEGGTRRRGDLEPEGHVSFFVRVTGVEAFDLF